MLLLSKKINSEIQLKLYNNRVTVDVSEAGSGTLKVTIPSSRDTCLH